MSTPQGLTRRELLAVGMAAAGGEPQVRLSIGTYGMKALAVDDALAAIRRIGYDGAELGCREGWPSAPRLLSSADRRRIRESGFPVRTLWDSFDALADDGVLDRIRALAALAHDLAPGNPPMIQTVIGGKAGDWPGRRRMIAGRVGEWGRVAAENKVRILVKAHIGHCVETPEALVELLDDVSNPAIVANYDYSHFQLRGITLEDSLSKLLPRSALVTVKDVKRLEGGKHRFLLAGDGTIDYPRYFGILKRMEYRGWMMAEVSAQVWNAPGYEPVAAAEHSYRNIAPVLRAAKLR